MSEISRQLNVSVRYLMFDSWGSLKPNGTWVGQMIGAMQEGRADVAITNIWHMPSVYTAMDFGPSTAKVLYTNALLTDYNMEF